MTSASISDDYKSSGVFSWMALAVGVGIVVSTGALYGSYSQRWGPPVELVAAGLHLDSMPRQFGRWQLIEELPMEDTALKMLECAGYVNRRYVDKQTGQAVAVTIIVGPPGPTAVHTPEICYSSRAYQIQKVRKAIAIEGAHGESHALWCVDFKTRNLLADQLRTYYAWSRGSLWEASNSPRYEFAAAPLLYKIQLASQIDPGTTSDDRDPCKQFIKELVNSNWTIDPS